RIFQFWFEQQHISPAIGTLFAILAVEVAAGKRLWCRYICPQSVLISLVKQLNRRRLQVGYDSDACLNKNKTDTVCVRACSLGLDPKGLNHWPETECTNCGDCIIACKKRGGALTFRTLPIRHISGKR
ncbi:MAG: 4Fe-4S binding protein, partial [Desulfobacterales bacterium]|nr:4Fe-4S binding protein [Desulfobacterales bacterium]